MSAKCSGLTTESVGRNPYVFVLGSPRSGTTLLRRILDAHSRIAIAPESEWIAEYYKKRTGMTPEGVVTRDLATRLVEHPKFHCLGICGRELEVLVETGEPTGYAQFVSQLLDRYGWAQGKPLVGDKTPGYVRQIHVLHRLWPGAKFIHLIRDGRDVCLSVLNWKRKAARLAELFPTWAEDQVMTAALCWERDARQGSRRGRLLGHELYREIRYEHLVTQPAEEIQELCSFLGVPYESAMLEFHQGRTRSDPGLSPKAAWLPITPGLRDWRKQMKAGDIERFEATAGGLLDELNYPRGCPSPPRAVQDTAARLRDRFARELSARAESPTDRTAAVVGGGR